MSHEATAKPDNGYWPDQAAAPGTPEHHHAEVLHDKLGMARLRAEGTLPIEPPPTAIEPSRVLVLNDDEQRLVIETIESIVAPFIDEEGVARQLAADDQGVPVRSLMMLRDRVAYGDEYVNPVDELTRITLRKRRLENEVRRCNIRIAQVEEQVVEEFAEAGDTGRKHAGTGATLTLARKIWAKVVKQGEKATPDEKAAAAEGLIAAGLDDFVRPDFNTNTVSAHFRELINAYDAEQRQLPEHKRVPRPAADFLPPELQGLIELDDTPHITVRA